MDPWIMGTYHRNHLEHQPFFASRDLPDADPNSLPHLQVLLKDEKGDFVWQTTHTWETNHNQTDPSVQIKKLQNELEEKSVIIQPLREETEKQKQQIEQLEAKVRALEKRRKVQIEAIAEKVLEALEVAPQN